MAAAQSRVSSMSRGAGTRWTAAALLWISLCGSVCSRPPAVSRTKASPLEQTWETLFSRSYLGITGGESEPNWESDYLQGVKRVRRLYCNVGIGFHLQVLPDGAISGAHSESRYSLLEISAVDRGVISLFGVKSGMFVAMDSRGRLYGTSAFVDECKFRETLLPNNYNAYESFVYKGFYVALSKHGRARRGNRATAAMTATHFLPRL